MSCKRPLSTLTSLNFRLVQKKIRKITKKHEKLQHFGLKTPKNELLTLNYGPPGSFITLSTLRTTKIG